MFWKNLKQFYICSTIVPSKSKAKNEQHYYKDTEK